MSTRAAALVVVVLCARTAWAQGAVPTIRAHSRVVTITDGLHVKKDYWYLLPDKPLDVYHVEIPRRPHTVTFTTDVESISFDVTFGSQHEFIIRLDDGRECRTAVRAEYKSLLPYTRAATGAANGPDVIPFTIGDNDKIYVKGRLNGGESLDFQVDFGAGGSIVKKGSVPKTRMTFDGTVRLRNSDGDNEVPSSSRNQLEIAGLRWEGVPFAVADNMTHREDGLIGNALFQDKVVEVDYDRMVLAIHETLPALSPGWLEQDMILDGVVPFVRGTLAVGDAVREGWFMLDTGAYTSILNSDHLSATSKVAGELRRMLGPMGGHSRPALTVGGHTFTTANFSVRRYDGDVTALGVIGNDVLRRFNLVIDNQRGQIHFRPNGHLGAPFRNPEYYLVRAVGAVLLATVATIWFILRRTPRGHTPP